MQQYLLLLLLQLLGNFEPDSLLCSLELMQDKFLKKLKPRTPFSVLCVSV